MDLNVMFLLVGCVLVIVAVVLLLRGTTGIACALPRIDALESRLEQLNRSLQDEFRSNREETGNCVHRLSDTLVRSQAELANAQQQQWTAFRAELESLRYGVEGRVENLRDKVEQRLQDLRRDNAARLDEMRQTVDEKLQTTLEARLGESFRQVSERLEQVYRGLGEMQALATGVGDLKKVLANVKARGTWGEVQLETLLEQALARDQYDTNVATNELTGERVEFAIRLPGRSGNPDENVWLPIDAKFPLEDYHALVDAMDRSDATAIDDAGRRLESRVKGCAKDIGVKYVNSPRTTDFAIMFLPIEGLYAEVLRRPGLADAIQRDYRVLLAGPTTLWALLSGLQMGFKTLAIERRSSEVWALLGAVKTEFGKFGRVLDGIQKNLHRASTKIDEARKGTRKIERKLTQVQELPAADAAGLLDGVVLEGEEPHVVDAA
jgi:DNA recombination protein RmuC